MAFSFGKDITYEFYAVEDRDALDLSGVSTAPAIYVYKTGYKPNRTQAAAGTDNGGLVGAAITTWTATTRGNGKTFTIPAISDPDATSNIESYSYWLVINFYLKTGGDKQTIVRALPMRRIAAHHKAIDVINEDLKGIFDSIDIYANSAGQIAAIANATSMTENNLDAKGFEWSSLWRPDRLNEAVKYRAVAQIILGEAQKNDEFIELYKTFRDVSENTINVLKIEYISQSDARAEEVKKSRGGGMVRLVR